MSRVTHEDSQQLKVEKIICPDCREAEELFSYNESTCIFICIGQSTGRCLFLMLGMTLYTS